jgi:hypothetical protein
MMEVCGVFPVVCEVKSIPRPGIEFYFALYQAVLTKGENTPRRKILQQAHCSMTHTVGIFKMEYKPKYLYHLVHTVNNPKR